jgi:hypothetical protein
VADQPNIFEDTNTSTQAQAPGTQGQNPPTNVDADTLLNLIVNEKGERKYRDINAALVALQHSQAYIPDLKNQLTEAQRQAQEAQAEKARVVELEAAVRRLTEKQDEPSTNGKAPTSEDIAKVVQEQIDRQRQADAYRANTQQVVESMKLKFGDKAEAEFTAKAQELGFSIDEMNALSAKNPKAVLTLFGASVQGVQRQPNTAPTTSSIRSDGFTRAPDSLIGREKEISGVGTTSQDIAESFNRAVRMTEELHANGLSAIDLANPKEYAKYFKK